MGSDDTIMPEWEDDRVVEETKGAVFFDTPLIAVIMEKAVIGSAAVIMGMDAGRASLYPTPLGWFDSYDF